METAELHVINKIAWQFFATLTFKSERLPERVRLALFFALLREFLELVVVRRVGVVV